MSQGLDVLNSKQSNLQNSLITQEANEFMFLNITCADLKLLFVF